MLLFTVTLYVRTQHRNNRMSWTDQQWCPVCTAAMWHCFLFVFGFEFFFGDKLQASLTIRHISFTLSDYQSRLQDTITAGQSSVDSLQTTCPALSASRGQQSGVQMKVWTHELLHFTSCKLLLNPFIPSKLRVHFLCVIGNSWIPSSCLHQCGHFMLEVTSFFIVLNVQPEVKAVSTEQFWTGILTRDKTHVHTCFVCMTQFLV